MLELRIGKNGLLLLAFIGIQIASIAATRFFKPFNVSYDHRALIIDGKRRMLISAGIHYPRATQDMWPGLIAKSKEGGADVIQTYVFWGGHEPVKGQYNFEGRYDLVKFIKLAGSSDLYFHLRIGPYVCAEWNFGGFPVWLRDVPGIEFRTDNQPFKAEMERFVKKIVDLMQENMLFSWQGGPIILLQIENEYGNIESSYGDGGKKYMAWAAQMAIGLGTGVPWVMCRQTDAPENILDTCNAFYCDGFRPNSYKKPALWTEDWNGWYASWGGTLPHRPVEDNAFAVARFFQRGGCFHNYYMFFGGTNFDRTAGGPLQITSYDYDAPIDEYGLLSQPKWGHLKDLHAAIKLCEPALVAVDVGPQYQKLGPKQEAHVYSDTVIDLNSNLPENVSTCSAFLANIDEKNSKIVKFLGRSYTLPPWSVSILPDCKNVAYNTAKIPSLKKVSFGIKIRTLHQRELKVTSSSGNNLFIYGDKGVYYYYTTLPGSASVACGKPCVLYLRFVSYHTSRKTTDFGSPNFSSIKQSEHLTLHDEDPYISKNWMSFKEPIGAWDENFFTAEGVLEHLNVTKDTTDYLWYITRITISKEDILSWEENATTPSITIGSMRDLVHIFVNGQFAGSEVGNWISVKQPVQLVQGTNEIALMSETIGLQNYGAFLEKDGAGFKGPVKLTGLRNGEIDLSMTSWTYQVGLKGEFLKIYTPQDHESVDWVELVTDSFPTRFMWYKTFFDAPAGNHPVSIYLGSMGKGFAWVNGYGLGRYWSLVAPENGCSEPCNYRGTYNENKCTTNCGKPTQSWYHIPRSWLQSSDNLLVLFEETGGNPFEISLKLHVTETVCSVVSESNEPPLSIWSHPNFLSGKISITEIPPEAHLQCDPGQTISSVTFASFGNPSGSCQNFSNGNCHASNSMDVVSKTCMGKNSCQITVSRKLFADDGSCGTVVKTLAVEAKCSPSKPIANVEII